MALHRRVSKVTCNVSSGPGGLLAYLAMPLVGSLGSVWSKFGVAGCLVAGGRESS